MIGLQKIRSLDLEAPPQAGRAAHLSAASGLVRIDGRFYVVADDELSLGVFDSGSGKPGRLVQLVPGELPLDPAERKAAKPDFESLFLLPPFPGFERGGLFALGSGSKKKRHKGVLLSFDANGKIAAPQAFDLADMFAPLHDAFDKVNIEGALVAGDELRLFQRGNKKDRRNAVVRCKLRPVLDALAAGTRIPPLEILANVAVELGETGGVPFSFTDAALLADGNMIFTAAAEDTEDTYNDGPCAGCAVGIIGPQGNLVALEQTSDTDKIEGIAAEQDGDRVTFFVVTDADDEKTAASLLSGEFAVPG